jgi:uncharacterized repeat protein (TIGR03803 family)
MKRFLWRSILRSSLLAALGFTVALSPVRAQYTNLHEFAGGAGDGSGPYGSLTVNGTNLFGMTLNGGAFSHRGVVFKINVDGSGYTNLHEFAGGTGDGYAPEGSLTVSNNTLYGMTHNGGAANLGVVFKMNADGTSYTNLHEFAGGSGDGALPGGSLTMSNNALYGMTSAGGTTNAGVVFKINVNGSGYTNLHSFTGSNGDGYLPFGSLALSGTNLYGMTELGGASFNGVVFKVNVDGSGYTNLHEFADGSGDGATPVDSLTVSGTTLYGMTVSGGAYSNGVVFRINTDGSSYTNLHEFAGNSGDGAKPYGSLITSNNTLYGMTEYGGAANLGVVFQINVDGTGYTDLHEFAGGSGDGAGPFGSLVMSGNMLYGMTPSGGASNLGVVFALQVSRIIGLTGSLTFGDVPVGITAQQTLTITNSGNVALNVTSIIYPAGFSGTWSGSVPSGKSTNVTVTFAPLAAISYGGTLTVNSDATDGTNTLAVAGTGFCYYTLSATSTNVTASGGGGSVGLTTGNSCGWTAISTDDWLHTSSSGAGSGSVSYTVDTNLSIAARSGVIAVQQQTFTVAQDANGLATIGNTPVVAAGDTLVFGVGAFDPEGQSVSNVWNFGDGATSTDANPSYAFTNCGPHVVSLTMYPPGAPVITNFVVSVACPFEAVPRPLSLSTKVNFVTNKVSSASLKGLLDLPVGTIVSNVAAQLSIGSVDVSFTLNGKGTGLNGVSNLKLSRKGKPVASNQLWQVSAKLQGDLDTVWAGDGFINATTNLTLSVPVLLLLDTDPPESFYMEKPLLYKAKAGKSGSAK